MIHISLKKQDPERMATKKDEELFKEFGWSVRDISMKDSYAESEYFMMRSERLKFDNVTLKGKYSFQYIIDSEFNNCNFDTKDAFWHAENLTIKNSTVKGESVSQPLVRTWIYRQ